MGVTASFILPVVGAFAFSLLGRVNAERFIRALLLGLLFSYFHCNPSLVLAVEWYIDAGVATSGDGKTWDTAFQKIQEGIDAATDGDNVIVKQGTYVENIHFNGKNIVLQSADALQPAAIDGGQRGPVVTFAGTENEFCIISGFNIRNGRAGNAGGILGGTPESHTRATIKNNRMTLNCSTAVGGGGGLAYCDGLIENNVISGNCSVGVGAGLSHCHGIIKNNIIHANSAHEKGGALAFCDAAVENNTIYQNSAGEIGGGLYWCRGTIRNCIIWGNTSLGLPPPPIPGLGNAQLFESSVPIHSCIQDWAGGGEGNIAEDPRFVDPAGGDFRVQQDSPCIDAGVNYYWFAWPERDADGNCRLAGERVDMGCYEYGPSADSDGDLLCDADEGGRGTDPHGGDTDGDSLPDGLEVLRGCDPQATTPARVVHVSCDVPSIQESLCLAVNGDEIVLDPGIYYENLQFCGVDVVLRGPEPEDPDKTPARLA